MFGIINFIGVLTGVGSVSLLRNPTGENNKEARGVFLMRKNISNLAESNHVLRRGSERGFSAFELLVTVAVIGILSGAAIYSIAAHQRLYRADDQALNIIDVLQEARQRSLTQRETMRVEVDLTDNVVRLIDENTVGDANDDEVIRSITLMDQDQVKLDARPESINENPPEEFPVPSAQFKHSIYPKSLTHDVSTIRFLSNGTIVDAGTNAAGDNATSVGVTLHVWSPANYDEDQPQVARAITVLGATGSIRLWEHKPSIQTTSPWQDSRRTSVYGGQQTQAPTATPQQ